MTVCSSAHATIQQDAFLNRRTCCMQRIVDAVLAFIHFDFGRSADADDRDTAGELGEPLLQLLVIIVGCRLPLSQAHGPKQPVDGQDRCASTQCSDGIFGWRPIER